MADLAQSKALEEMERDFERSKAALLRRFLQDQEELALRLKNMGLRRHTTNDITDSSDKQPGVRSSRQNRRREGISRPKTAAGHRTRRCHTVRDNYDYTTINNNDEIVVNKVDDVKTSSDFDTADTAVMPTSTSSSRRIRPKTSVGFYEGKTDATSDDSDVESEVSNASIASIAGGDVCADSQDLEQQLNFEDLDDVEFSYEQRFRHGELAPGQYSHQNRQLIYARRDDFEMQNTFRGVYDGERDDALRPQTSNSTCLRSMDAGEKINLRRPSSLHKRRVKDINSASSLYLTSSKPLISIHNQQTDAAKLGLSLATRVECDADLYKKLRNKSAPGQRHQSDLLGARKPISVYHLPPLDKSLVSNREAGSTTPASTASFHGTAPYIEADLQ